MKFLTIRQPWASLIASGTKTIETRGWSTKYRGPLAIHAGMAMPKFDFDRDKAIAEALGIGIGVAFLAINSTKILPRGALVAVCDLVDVIPMVHSGEEGAIRTLDVDDNGSLWIVEEATDEEQDDGDYVQREVTDQRPFGDFAPGRFAWLLGNVRRLAEPVPMKGAQGLRDLPADIEERLAS